jgi:hypothetical protein
MLVLCFALVHYCVVMFCVCLFVMCAHIMHQLDHEVQIIGINSEVHNQVETCIGMVLCR